MSVLIIQLQKCISIKICGIKAVSCVLYSPSTSLSLDFRLPIGKDCWGSESPQVVYMQSRSPRDLIDYTWCFILSTQTCFLTWAVAEVWFQWKIVYMWYLIEKCICRAYETVCMSAWAGVKITGWRCLQNIIYLLAEIYLLALGTPGSCLSDFVPREKFGVKNCLGVLSYS